MSRCVGASLPYVLQVHQHPAGDPHHCARQPPGGAGDAAPSGHQAPASPTHSQSVCRPSDGPDALQVSHLLEPNRC